MNTININQAPVTYSDYMFIKSSQLSGRQYASNALIGAGLGGLGGGLYGYMTADPTENLWDRTLKSSLLGGGVGAGLGLGGSKLYDMYSGLPGDKTKGIKKDTDKSKTKDLPEKFPSSGKSLKRRTKKKTPELLPKEVAELKAEEAKIDAEVKKLKERKKFQDRFENVIQPKAQAKAVAKRKAKEGFQDRFENVTQPKAQAKARANAKAKAKAKAQAKIEDKARGFSTEEVAELKAEEAKIDAEVKRKKFQEHYRNVIQPRAQKNEVSAHDFMQEILKDQPGDIAYNKAVDEALQADFEKNVQPKAQAKARAKARAKDKASRLQNAIDKTKQLRESPLATDESIKNTILADKQKKTQIANKIKNYDDARNQAEFNSISNTIDGLAKTRQLLLEQATAGSSEAMSKFVDINKYMNELQQRKADIRSRYGVSSNYKPFSDFSDEIQKSFFNAYKKPSSGEISIAEDNATRNILSAHPEILDSLKDRADSYSINQLKDPDRLQEYNNLMHKIKEYKDALGN